MEIRQETSVGQKDYEIHHAGGASMLGCFHFSINLEDILNNESAQLLPFWFCIGLTKLLSVLKSDMENNIYSTTWVFKAGSAKLSAFWSGIGIGIIMV